MSLPPHRSYLLTLSVLFGILWVALAIHPSHRSDWFLENALAIAISKEPAARVDIHRGTKLWQSFNITGLLPIMSVAITATPLSDSEYAVRSAAVLDGIELTVDRWLQGDAAQVPRA